MDIVNIPRRFVRTCWGGTETVVLETSRRLARLGHRVEVYCPNALADRDAELIDSIPVRRFAYSYPYLGLSDTARRQLDLKGGNLFSFSLLHALLARPRLDLIHLHTGKRLGGIGRLAAAVRGIPYVITLHGGVHDVPAEESRRWTEATRGTLEWGKLLGWMVGSRRVLNDAAAILCLGPEEQRRTQASYPEKRVVLLPNGVDAVRLTGGDGPRFRRRHGIAAEATVLLTVGRIDPQKGQLLAVRALGELLREGGSFHLVLLGHVTDPVYCAQVQGETRAAGLELWVTLIPGVEADSPELLDAYAAADLLLLTSVHEPFGIVVLEAWAAGLPVVASCVGGVASLVEDGRDGIVFPPGDLRSCIAEVKALATNRDLRVSMAAAGRTKAAGTYSWDQITNRLATVYEEVRREVGDRRTWLPVR